MRRPPGARPAGGRRGFTMAEVTAALGILVLALAVVAEVGVQGLRERARADALQAAQELAANVLESARACPWEKLTPDWAAGQRLPEPYEGRGWRLQVRVEPEASRPRIKRVTVEVHWAAREGDRTRPVQLVGLFGARSDRAPGGKP